MFKDYHKLYLKTDVLLLADVFDEFWKVIKDNYSLEPCWYLGVPGLGWDAMLKTKEHKLELFHTEQYDMLLFAERAKRGGISMISKRHSKANNKYMKDYDPNQESKYLFYVDANNLYGKAMIQKLPVGD
jgi:hypothetical protein